MGLLYARQFAINDYISVTIPTVREILQDEETYYALVSSFTAMPIDMMVPLDDVGVDFTKINEYQLFLMLFDQIRQQDTSLILGDLDLTKFELAINPQNNLIVLRDNKNGITIDRAIHGRIAMFLRELHHLKQDNRKPANKEAKKYMIERARAKAKRQARLNKNKAKASELEQLIVALVNTEQFKYDYETVKDITIYQFNESVQQIVNKIDYEHRMAGIYAGTIKAKDLKPEDLNWLYHK